MLRCIAPQLLYGAFVLAGVARHGRHMLVFAVLLSCMLCTLSLCCTSLAVGKADFGSS